MSEVVCPKCDHTIEDGVCTDDKCNCICWVDPNRY